MRWLRWLRWLRFESVAGRPPEGDMPAGQGMGARYFSHTPHTTPHLEPQIPNGLPGLNQLVVLLKGELRRGELRRVVVGFTCPRNSGVYPPPVGSGSGWGARSDLDPRLMYIQRHAMTDESRVRERLPRCNPPRSRSAWNCQLMGHGTPQLLMGHGTCYTNTSAISANTWAHLLRLLCPPP